MVKKYLLITLSLVVLSKADLLYSENYSTFTAPFQRIDAGARPAGMGGTFVGIANDINALYWNPAGLTSIEQTELVATYTQLIAGIMTGYVGFAYPMKRMNSTLGAAMTYLTTEGIEIRDDYGILQNNKSVINNIAVSLVYSQQIIPLVSVGANIKYIAETYGTAQGGGIAADLSALLRIMDTLSAGINIQNLGTGIKVGTSVDPLPMTIKLGAGYLLLKNTLTLGFDLELPAQRPVEFHLGAEYLIGDRFFIRAGYGGDVNFAELKGLTVGCGIKTFMRLTEKKSGYLQKTAARKKEAETDIDYALLTYGNLFGDQTLLVHRLSVTMKF